MTHSSQLTPTKNATPKQMHDAPKVKHSMTINRPHKEVYAFFRNFKNLPLFMKDLKSIDLISPKISHWVIELKNGFTAEWDAEIIADIPGEMISWQSINYAQVDQAGSIWFIKAPANLGTIVRLSLSYKIPTGKLGEFATKLIGEDPDTLILTNLHRLKSLLETGEIPTTKGQPSGRDEDLPHEMKH